MKYSLGISNFLEEISSLSHSVVFLYFFALIAEESFLISPCYSLYFLLFIYFNWRLTGFAIHQHESATGVLWTLHSDDYIFPFLLSLLPLFSQLFVAKCLARQPFCFFAFLFHGDGLDSCLLYNVTNFIP